MTRMTRISCLILLGALLSATAHAQNFPTRPMRVLVPLAAGGGMDSVSRSLAASFSDAFGQSVVVEGGVVLAVSGDGPRARATVRFDQHGDKQLVLSLTPLRRA